MPELTSRPSSSCGEQSFASTIRARRPSPSRTMRPYSRTSSGSNERTVPAAFSRRCVASRSRSVCDERPGTSPFSTSTSPPASCRVSRAARTASPVPRGTACTATSSSGNLSTASGDVTTTTRSVPASRAAWTTQSTRRRPSNGCRCFGVALFMRVPRPAAMTTAVTSFAMRSVRDGGWGARIRTWDHGTKTRCLTAWPRPRAWPILPAAVEEQIGEADDREDDDRHDEGPLHDPREDDRDHGEELRGGEDPEHAADDVRTALAAAQIGQDGDDRERDHRPLGDVVREEDDQRLDRRDPERDADAAPLEPASGAARTMVDRVRGVAQHRRVNRTTLVPSAT